MGLGFFFCPGGDAQGLKEASPAGLLRAIDGQNGVPEVRARLQRLAAPSLSPSEMPALRDRGDDRMARGGGNNLTISGAPSQFWGAGPSSGERQLKRDTKMAGGKRLEGRPQR